MKTLYRAIVLLILIAVFSCPVKTQVITSSRIGSSVTNLEEGKWKVILSPKDRWFDTGAKVPSGTMLRISASGRVTWAPPGGRNMSSTVGPSGTRLPFPEDSARFPMPQAGCGSLIMRIGNSMFAVGDGGFIQVDEAGTIQLMVNDDDLSDNTGNFSINIEIVRPIQKVEIRGFIFELIDARMLSGKVAVSFFLTSNGKDREISINNCGYVDQNTRLFDNSGAKYEASSFRIANSGTQRRIYKAPLVADTRVFTEITFDNVSPNANRIALLEVFATEEDYAGVDCWKIQFRNVTLVR